VFADPVVVTAILDRLLHHSHVLTIRGDSYQTAAPRHPTARACTGGLAVVFAGNRTKRCGASACSPPELAGVQTIILSTLSVTTRWQSCQMWLLEIATPRHQSATQLAAGVVRAGGCRWRLA
jgi:hypothetical protein